MRPSGCGRKSSPAPRRGAWSHACHGPPSQSAAYRHHLVKRSTPPYLATRRSHTDMLCPPGESFLSLLVPNDPSQGFRAGDLREDVYALSGLSTSCRVVGVAQSVLVHIWGQRGDRDARIVFDGLTLALQRPVYAGPDRRNSTRCWVVGESAARGRLVCLVVKFVSAVRASSAVDELWISTGYTLPKRRLTNYVRRGILHSIDKGKI
jgi:hypothetical protein